MFLKNGLSLCAKIAWFFVNFNNFEMFLLLVVVSLLIALVFGAAFRRKNYWKSRGVKGPEPVVFLGNLDVLGNPVDTQQPQVYHK